MPRFPDLSRAAGLIRGQTFSAFSQRLQDLRESGKLIPLHIGDTYLPPPQRALDALALVDDSPAAHVYGPPGGGKALRKAASEWYGFGSTPETTWITPGATGGLSLACRSILSPGDEVLVVCPSWPLIFGIIQSVGAIPVEVVIGPGGWPEEEPNGYDYRLRSAITPNTVAIYYCNPNNPAGFIFDQPHIEATAKIAKEHDLWILADEAYRDLVLQGPHVPMTDYKALRDRTFAVGSFSKSFSLAGHRVGYIVAPPELGEMIARFQTHATYHPSRVAQRMAQAAIAEGEEYLNDIRDRYRKAASLVAQKLKAKFHPAVAGYFVLIDLREKCPDEDSLMELLSTCLNHGISLCPGGVFGEAYKYYVRLCFTAVTPDALSGAIDILNDILS